MEEVTFELGLDGRGCRGRRRQKDFWQDLPRSLRAVSTLGPRSLRAPTFLLRLRERDARNPRSLAKKAPCLLSVPLVPRNFQLVKRTNVFSSPGNLGNSRSDHSIFKVRS